MSNSLNCKTINAFTGVDLMLFFSKKVDDKIITELKELIEKFNEEFHQSFMPKEVSCLWYLGGNERIDTLCEHELTNFNLHNLFDYKNASLIRCLEDFPQVRKSFFYSLNNIKQNQNFEDDDALFDFLKEKGKFFINDYLKSFQKSAEYYNKKSDKGKLPEYRELFTWIDEDELCFLDKLFVYLGDFRISLNDIVACFKDENLARTILKYTENGEEKEMRFNLAAFAYFEKNLPAHKEK